MQTKRYIVRFVSGTTDQVEEIDPKPVTFEGTWRVWKLDYQIKTQTTPYVLARISQQVINMEAVEKIQDAVE